MQMSLDAFKKLDNKSLERCTRAVAYFVGVEALPHNIVESNGFRVLCDVLRPGFGAQCPGRRAFAETHIPRMYNETRETLSALLKSAGNFAITLDAWTSVAKTPYIGVTVHFVTPQWELESFCLDCIVLDVDHTGINIAEAVKVVLHDWDIPKSSVKAATSDNGSNVVLAVDLLKIRSVRCYAHSLQIGVHKVYEDKEVKPVIKKAKAIQALLSASNKLRRDAGLLASNRSVKFLAIPAACDTRWWSTLHLVKRVLDQHDIIQATFSLPKYAKKNYGEMLLSPAELRVLRTVIQVLAPLEKMCDEMAGEAYVTASAILPLVQLIEECRFEPEAPASDSGDLPDDWDNTDHSMNDLGTSLLLHIQTSLKKRYQQVSPTGSMTFLQTITYLDPRFRVDYASEDDIVKVKESLIDEEEEEVRTRSVNADRSSSSGSGGDCSSATATTPSSATPHGPPQKKAKGLAALFAGKRAATTLVERSPKDVLMAEMEAYLRIPPTDMAEDPLLWWKAHAGDFPNLAAVAKKYLCIPGTSVPAERVFSCGGRVVTPMRSCLTGEHASQQIFVSMNKIFVQVPK